MNPATPRALFAEGVSALVPEIGADAPGDARRLLEHAFARADSTTARPSASDESVSDATASLFRSFVRQRHRRKPVSRILGYRDFWTGRFRVTDDVLDPRPETELLVEKALEVPAFSRVLDLGTGTGCILGSLLAERPQATGVGIDVSPEALEVASDNLAALNVADRVQLFRSDWFSEVTGEFDLIVSNPPYIANDDIAALQPEVRLWEPSRSIMGGADGLEAYRRIAAGLMAHLSPDGRVVLEIGASQAQEVCMMFKATCGLDSRVHKDLAGLDRVVCLWRPQ